MTAAKLGNINVRSATATVSSSGYGEATASCQTGERVLSGDVAVNNTALSDFTPILESYAQDNGWYARFNNGATGTRVFTVYVYCLA